MEHETCTWSWTRFACEQLMAEKELSLRPFKQRPLTDFILSASPRRWLLFSEHRKPFIVRQWSARVAEYDHQLLGRPLI